MTDEDIQAQVDAQVAADMERIKRDMEEAEIRNRRLDEIHKIPGYKGYWD